MPAMRLKRSWKAPKRMAPWELQVVLVPEVICRRLGPAPMRATVNGTAALASAAAQSQRPRSTGKRASSLLPALDLAATVFVEDLGCDPIYKGITPSVMPQFTVGLTF